MERQIRYMKGFIKDRWFVLAVILLGAFFLFKMVSQAQIISYFPLDQNNDLGCYLGGLHHLAEFGFHNIAPNWYNGYIVLNHYPPGWFFFTLPIYMLLGNIQLAAFISHLLIYMLGLVFFILIGKSQNFSLTKTLFFYLVFYVNPIAVGNFIKLGRLPELLALTLFVGFFAVILHLKEKPITISSILFFVLLYSAVLLAHPSWFILSSFFVPGIFILKNRKEKIMIAIAATASILMASFWLIPYLSASFSQSFSSYVGLARLFDFKRYFFDNLFSFLLPLFLCFSAFFYFRSLNKNKSRKEMIFYSILFLLSILYFTRLAAFIPVINVIFPDTYNMLFIFFALFFFIKTPQEVYGKIWQIVKIGLVLLPLVFIISSILFVPNFRTHNKIDNEILSVLPSINMDDKFLIEGMPYPTSSLAFYSYASICCNLSTPNGAISDEISHEMLKMLVDTEKYFIGEDCNNFTENIKRLNATVIISYKDYCKFLGSCGLNLNSETESICLYKMAS